MTRAGLVLIVTDRSSEAEGLARSLRLVCDCTVIGLHEAVPNADVAAIVLDVDARRAHAPGGAIARLAASPAPRLFLARRHDAVEVTRARGWGADVILRAATPPGAIIATLLKLLDDDRPRPSSPSHARVAAARRHVSTMLDDASAGRAPSPEVVDMGTEIVVAAIEDAGIRAWLEVVWAHDDHLYQHVLSVTGYAAAFASSLGFPAADRLRLAKAALLHDVGKTQIPVAILDKPGRLDAAETSIMREHPALGAAMLACQPGFDAGMIDVVRHHHEMLDGSGYPDGLSGAAIDDPVRLVTICDIYSALTERRPYRAPMPGRAAYAHLEGMTGKIDMVLLRAFRPVFAEAAVSIPA